MRIQKYCSLLVAFLAFLSVMPISVQANQQNPELPKPTTPSTRSNKTSLIQVAILLDTSGSMKGLVDQARIQIWNVVNELSASSLKGNASELEVAVFQYGSDRLSKSDGYIRRVLDFSGDLDEVSRALFSLSARGGNELCGEAIRQACDDLNWSRDAGYRAIFIAGNEAFDQGETSFASVLPRIQDKEIKINSVYCRWKDAKKRESALWEYSAIWRAATSQ